MTITEIITESLKDAESISSISPQFVLVVAICSILCSLVIYFTYKKFYRGAVYSENFNLLNVLMCIITALIIAVISSNLVMSLGMVGALSIVRFRSAVKDPLDIGFLFWSIATGIAIGAGYFPFAIISVILIAAIYIVFTLAVSGVRTYLLVVKYEEGSEEIVRQALKTIKNSLKCKSNYKGKVELTVQVKFKGNRTDFLQTISNLEGVDSAMLVEYTGDYL